MSALSATEDTRQAFITEMWAKARYEATQLDPRSEQTVQFFDRRGSIEPQDTDLRTRVITAWQCAKAAALKEVGTTISRLQDSVNANAQLRDYCKTEEAIGGKFQDPKAPKLRRNSTDFSSMIVNLNRFIGEAIQKRGALLALPDTPFVV